MASKRIDGYQIRYSSKASMNNSKTLTVKGYNKTALKIKDLKKNKKYYFQIRTCMNTDKGITMEFFEQME